MKKYSVKNIIISSPFFALGAAFIGGALWTVVSRLLEGLVWNENDSYVIGAVVFLLIFGGAFVQFALNALTEGRTKNTKPLISPLFYYILSILFIVPGAWSALYGSINALIVAFIGIALAAYGYNMSRKMRAVPQEQ